MFTLNPLLKTDSYKLSHADMYPEGMVALLSNFTSRGSRIDGVKHGVNFGLQAYLTDLQEDFEKFFAADRDEVVEDYRKNTETFVAPNFTLDRIAALHDLGYLPVRFSAIAEGWLVPMKVPSILIENTHEDFAWLVNYFETNLSATVWHPSTTATTAWDLRRTLDKAAAQTSSAPEAVDYQLHDFSYRGMVNWQAAAASSAAHLLSFRGTDTVPAIGWVAYYYPGEDNGVIGVSVPATEHSVMCAGQKDNEIETVRRLLKKYPTGILSIVADTWSLKKFITEILVELKDDIMARDGKLVVRPDSGDPADIICGNRSRRRPSITERGGWGDMEFYDKGAIYALYEIFGGTRNEKGFIELDSHIGLIYGDGITKERLVNINERLRWLGFASTNWVAGVGSYTYQMVTRDTLGSAVKATWMEDEETGGHNIFKDPETDSGLKKSATGRLAVKNLMNGELYLIQEATPEQEEYSLLEPVWENGKFLKTVTFNEVRENLKRSTAILERAGII